LRSVSTSPETSANKRCSEMKPKTRVLAVKVLALSAALCSGMALGILYAHRNPVQVLVGHVCRIQIPEFLIPSTT
jgi:hypothetical protein